MGALFRSRGFVHTLVAFVCSIGISNVVSTFLDHLLAHLGYDAPTIGAVGAGFQIAIMAGSLAFGAAAARVSNMGLRFFFQ